LKLTHLRIENFRGIDALSLDLSDTTVLIGENNSGKTTVLAAIRIALSELRSTRSNVFELYDFRLATPTSEPSTSPPIVFTLTFDEGTTGAWPTATTRRLNAAKILQVDVTRNTGKVILQVRATCSSTHEINVDVAFLDLSGATLPFNDGQLGALQSEVSCFYLSALRDAAKHFDPKGPFWRAFLKGSVLTAEAKAEIDTKLKEVNELIVQSHKSFADVAAGLQSVQDVVPMGPGDTVSIEAVPGRVFDMLSKAQVHLGTPAGAKIPVVNHGEGTQSLAVLMLFKAFLQVRRGGVPLLALEEPEAHLHPSAVRSLWKVVQSIPGQKIVSTHSGDILSEVEVQDVVRLSRAGGATSVARLDLTTLLPKQVRQFNFHVRQARGELLFARCWILVEGETECVVLPAAAQAAGVDLHRHGIRVIQYRQSDIGLYISVAQQLGIQWCAFPDNDPQGTDDQQKVNDAFGGTAPADVLHVMPHPDIEHFLCSNGFGAVYAYLSAQTQARVTVPPGAPAYWSQVTKAVSKHKTAAASDVADEILKNAIPVPPLMVTLLKAAEKLASL